MLAANRVQPTFLSSLGVPNLLFGHLHMTALLPVCPQQMDCQAQFSGLKELRQKESKEVRYGRERVSLKDSLVHLECST